MFGPLLLHNCILWSVCGAAWPSATSTEEAPADEVLAFWNDESRWRSESILEWDLNSTFSDDEAFLPTDAPVTTTEFPLLGIVAASPIPIVHSMAKMECKGCRRRGAVKRPRSGVDESVGESTVSKSEHFAAMRIRGLEILLNDPRMSAERFVEGMRLQFKAVGPRKLMTLRINLLAAGRTPLWLHDLLVDNELLFPDRMDEILELVRMAYRRRKTDSRGQHVGRIPYWFKFCIRPLLAGHSPPPCALSASESTGTGPVMMLSLEKLKEMFSDQLSDISRSWGYLVSGTTTPLPPIPPAISATRMAMEALAENPDRPTSSLMEVVLSRNPGASRDRIRDARRRVTEQRQIPGWLHTQLMKEDSPQSGNMPTIIRRAQTRLCRQRNTNLSRRLPQQIREWFKYCIDPLRSGHEPAPCERLTHGNSVTIQLSAEMTSVMIRDAFLATVDDEEDEHLGMTG